MPRRNLLAQSPSFGLAAMASLCLFARSGDIHQGRSGPQVALVGHRGIRPIDHRLSSPRPPPDEQIRTRRSRTCPLRPAWSCPSLPSSPALNAGIPASTGPSRRRFVLPPLRQPHASHPISQPPPGTSHPLSRYKQSLYQPKLPLHLQLQNPPAPNRTSPGHQGSRSTLRICGRQCRRLAHLPKGGRSRVEPPLPVTRGWTNLVGTGVAGSFTTTALMRAPACAVRGTM